MSRSFPVLYIKGEQLYMFMGIFAAALTALLQSFSYISSAAFNKRYDSSFKLMIYSQFAMGVVSVPISLIFFPAGLLETPVASTLWMILWILITCAGQYFFFATQKEIESSRLSSLLGLKIVVLAVITMAFSRQMIPFLRIIAILLATVGAVCMNGGKATRRVSLKAVLLLASTVVTYCVADLVETKLLNMSRTGNIWCDGLGVCATCYMLLGVLMIPLFKKIGFSGEQLKCATPYGVLYFFSQVALFVSFGLVGPVFANVVQSSRGMISVAIGVLLCQLGFSSLDVKGDRKLWIRRFICSGIMTAAIIIYACA